jgi:chromosome segregation ATPase
MTDITFFEIFQSYILPAAGAVGGLTALIIFVLSGPKRRAETDKTLAERDQVIQMTAGGLHKLTTDAAAQALEAQRSLIDNLQEEIRLVREQGQEDIVSVRSQAADLKCKLEERDSKITMLEQKVTRLEKELGAREENIENLKMKLQEYQEENKRYKRENEALKVRIELQDRRIKELEDELVEIRKRFQEHAK